MCAHREPVYRNLPDRMELPASEHASDHSMILPLFPQMTDDEQQRVVLAMKEAPGAG